MTVSLSFDEAAFPNGVSSGNATGAQVQFATLGAGLALTNDDFLVV